MDQQRQIIEARCNRFVVFFYCLLIYFLPISIALTESMAGFVICGFWVKKILLYLHDKKETGPASWSAKLRVAWDCFKVPESGLDKPMGLYVLAVLLSVLFSQSFTTSVIAFFAKLMEGYLLYVSFADCFRTKQHLRNFLTVYFVSALLMGINGIAQFFTHTEFVRGTPLVDGRVSSSLRHANDFGAYLSMVIPLILSMLLMPWSRVSMAEEWRKTMTGAGPAFKAVFLILFVATISCLGLTYSRGSWVGFLFSLAVVALLKGRNCLWVVGIGFAFMFIFTPSLEQTRNVSFTSDSVSTQKSLDMNYSGGELAEANPILRFFIENMPHHSFSGMGRVGFWNDGLRIIQRYPFFGSGLNTYSIMGIQYGYAHNCYLQTTAEIGLVGLVAFLIMLGFVFYTPLRDLAGSRDPFLKAVLAGAMAGLLGFLVQSFFDTSFYSVQLGNLMWIFIGLLVAARRLSRNN
jgi:putative inorganic carbon (HCO3(-)) transporter